MVEAADALQGDDLGTGRGRRLRRSAFGGIADRSVDSLRVVVVDVLAEKTSQVSFAEHDDVVEKLAANAADEALRCPVLPGALKGSPFRIQAERSDGASNTVREDRVVVEDQVPVRGVAGEGVP